MIMWTEAFEGFAVEHLPVVGVGDGYHELGPLLEALAVEVH